MSEVAQTGRTVLVVSHNLSTLRALCGKAAQFDAGRLIGLGSVDEQIDLYLKRMRAGACVELAERKDREGNGLVRVIELTVSDRYGNVATQFYAGDPWSVSITYKSRSLLPAIVAALSVWSVDGTKVFHVDSLMRSRRLGATLDIGKICCEFPRMNLAPGQYYINVMISIDHGIADHVYHAADFGVLEGDFFGDGRPIHAAGGIVLVEHDWKIVEAPVREHCA
jgi:lipopolysaccharide transport system ATP-binding protein